MAKQITEASVGKKAAKMLETSLQQVISTSGLKLSSNNDNRITSKSSKTYARMVRGDRKKLAGIAIHMPKHMFVHEHGANTYRESHEVQGKKTRFKRAGSRLKLPAKRLIAKAVRKSGAVDYLSSAISEIRSEEIVTQIIKTFDDGR